jgi:hypothetical protein
MLNKPLRSIIGSISGAWNKEEITLDNFGLEMIIEIS